MANPVEINISNFLPAPTTELPNLPIGNEDYTSAQLIIANGVDNTFKNGPIIKDLGYEKIGDTLQSGKSLTGLFHFIQSPTIDKILATINNSAGTNLTLKYNNAGVWTDITIGTTWNGFEDAKVEMESFISHCFMVGYDDTDKVFLPVATLNGTTFSTTDQITNMPQAKYIKHYKSRIYIGNCYYSGTQYPNRIYFSSIETAGAITWSPGTDFIDMDSPYEITGIYPKWDKLIVFTQFDTSYYDRVSDAKKQIWDIGCINNRTIQSYKSYLIWGDKDNIHLASSFGSDPEPIGNQILQLIRNSDNSKWTSEVRDDEYYLYLGNTSANGLDYTNCMATFNFRTLSWRWREMADDITVLTKYTASGDDQLYMGTASGMVMRKGKRNDATMLYSDNGEEIKAHFRLQAFDGNQPSIIKGLEGLKVYSEVCTGVAIRARLLGADSVISENIKWYELGQLLNIVEDLVIKDKINGEFIQIEGTEKSTHQSFMIDGLTMLISGMTTNQ